MVEWSKYFLKDIPFLAIPAIKITSSDDRTNGKIYYSKFAEKEIKEIMAMINLEAFPWVFLQTGEATLGNGKSAFMAHIYWNLKKEEKNVLWAYLRDEPRLIHLLSEILDAFVSEGKLQKLKKSVHPITPDEIRKCLKNSPHSYSDRVIHALNKLLNEDDDKLVYTFSIIKRSIPNQNHAELFGALIHLAYATGEKRFTIFLDQFEEYVKAHANTGQTIKLGNEINDLQREIGETTTLVASTHPEVTAAIISSTPEAETFTKIDSRSSVSLPLMTRTDLLEMTLTYLQRFRVHNYDGAIYYPFEEDVILYSAERTGLVPRDLILALRQGLLYGAIDDFPPINEIFLRKSHSKMFGGLENKWEAFKKDKWHHEIT
jgi:hypothetical protein